MKRVVRLARSVAQHNLDRIPFYISVPNADIGLFREHLRDFDVELLTDESILDLNPKLDQTKLENMSGSLSQQVVKSEFWRTGISMSYLCLDSDCVFIRPFQQQEFITQERTPYTVIDEGRDLLHPTLSLGKTKVIKNFYRESGEVQNEFGRSGKHYNYGPNCPVWDRRVWLSLDENYSKPRNLSFLDLILRSGNEQRWYGEALLKYRAIELLPSQPFFKMYHYAWQQKFDRRASIYEEQLKQLFCGVVYQSAWEREMDWPSEGGSWLSRLGRRIRRALNHT
jgi:hypothetical protein